MVKIENSSSNNPSNNLKNSSNQKNSNKDFEEGNLLHMFEEIVTSTNTVICSRVSPKQKADLITLVKKFEKEIKNTYFNAAAFEKKTLYKDVMVLRKAKA